MTKKKLGVLLSAALLAFSISALGAEKRFIIDDPGGRNIARFESKASLENIVGTTSAITGWVAFDPEDLSKNYAAEVAVDLATLKTGIEMRDGHLRSDKYLDTEKNPKATLKITKIDLGGRNSIKHGETAAIKASGLFTIHGVTKPVEITAKVGYFAENKELAPMGYPGEILNVDGSFVVKSADFNIQRPQLLILKLADEVTVSVNFTATTGRKPLASS